MNLPRICIVLFSISASVSLVLVPGACGQRDDAVPHRATGTPETEPADEQVVVLLKQMLTDSINDDKRHRALSSRITRLLGTKYWYKKYPTQYAREKLASQGKAVVEPLLRIVSAPQYTELRWLAWSVLTQFEDPRILQAMFDAVSTKRITPGQLAGMLKGHLPVRPSAEYLEEGAVVQWLEKQLATKSYDQIRLDLLDEFMRSEDEGVGTYSGIPERWLNRFYGIDFDVWLAKKAPKALGFRRKQLKKGYDPVTVF